MILKYKNFIIREDDHCFVLSEILTTDKGKEYEGNTTYPSSLENALKSLYKRLRTKYKDKELLELEDFLQEVRKINDEFISELREIIKK